MNGCASTHVASRATHQYKLLKIKKLLAERVGFEPLLVVDKELNGYCLPHDPLDPHEYRGRDTY